MKCDYCGKEIKKFCYAIPSGIYGNRTPWALCTLKCVAGKIKKYLKEKQERKEKRDAKKSK